MIYELSQWERDIYMYNIQKKAYLENVCDKVLCYAVWSPAAKRGHKC
jgi:hypothetical protein